MKRKIQLQNGVINLANELNEWHQEHVYLIRAESINNDVWGQIWGKLEDSLQHAIWRFSTIVEMECHET